MPWATELLSTSFSQPSNALIVLDPRALIAPHAYEGLENIERVADWYQLRRVWEISTYGQRFVGAGLVLLIQSEDFRDRYSLPYDIETNSVVHSFDPPLAEPLQPILRSTTSDDLAWSLIEAAKLPGDALGNFLHLRWGIDLAASYSNFQREVELVLRLRDDPEVGDDLLRVVGSRLAHPAASDLASRTDKAGAKLQILLQDFVAQHGVGSPSQDLVAIAPVLETLFGGKYLERVPVSSLSDYPSWVRPGLRVESSLERATRLVSRFTNISPPATLRDWTRVAMQWGDIRSSISLSSPDSAEVADAAWDQWSTLDQLFSSWIKTSLASHMTSASRWPSTVDRVGPFLARRIREGAAKGICLVVLDGMGFSQWSLLRERIGLKVLEQGACLAMAPTLTTVSRQALLAGLQPREFPETLRSTHAESRRWNALWDQELPGNDRIRFFKMVGADASEVPELGGSTAVAVVVNALDEMVHGADVLGDAQLWSSLETWIRHGFLESLIKVANEEGLEVWLTSDHGNLESIGAGTPKQEGLAVESAGKRVRWYATAELRQSGGVCGDHWDPPGLPAGLCWPVFARGRTGFFSGGVRVTHGGLSLDEVVVPLVRVKL